MSVHQGSWVNGKRSVRGTWEYYKPSDVFIIRLDQKDRVSGEFKRLVSHNDTPEWGNWKLVREVKP